MLKVISPEVIVVGTSAQVLNKFQKIGQYLVNIDKNIDPELFQKGVLNNITFNKHLKQNVN